MKTYIITYLCLDDYKHKKVKIEAENEKEAMEFFVYEYDLPGLGVFDSINRAKKEYA